MKTYRCCTCQQDQQLPVGSLKFRIVGSDLSRYMYCQTCQAERQCIWVTQGIATMTASSIFKTK